MEEHWLFPRNPKYSILLFLNGIIFCHILEIKVQNVSRLRLVIPLSCLVIIIWYFYLYMIIDWKFFQQTKFIQKITILCWLNNITNDFWKLVQSCRDFLLLLQLLFDYNCVNKFVFCPKAILNLISYKLDWWDFTGKRSPYLPFNGHICKILHGNSNNTVRWQPIMVL